MIQSFKPDELMLKPGFEKYKNFPPISVIALQERITNGGETCITNIHLPEGTICADMSALEVAQWLQRRLGDRANGIQVTLDNNGQREDQKARGISTYTVQEHISYSSAFG